MSLHMDPNSPSKVSGAPQAAKHYTSPAEVYEFYASRVTAHAHEVLKSQNQHKAITSPKKSKSQVKKPKKQTMIERFSVAEMHELSIPVS